MKQHFRFLGKSLSTVYILGRKSNLYFFDNLDNMQTNHAPIQLANLNKIMQKNNDYQHSLHSERILQRYLTRLRQHRVIGNVNERRVTKDLSQSPPIKMYECTMDQEL